MMGADVENCIKNVHVTTELEKDGEEEEGS